MLRTSCSFPFFSAPSHIVCEQPKVCCLRSVSYQKLSWRKMKILNECSWSCCKWIIYACFIFLPFFNQNVITGSSCKWQPSIWRCMLDNSNHSPSNQQKVPTTQFFIFYFLIKKFPRLCHSMLFLKSFTILLNHKKASQMHFFLFPEVHSIYHCFVKFCVHNP